MLATYASMLDLFGIQADIEDFCADSITGFVSKLSEMESITDGDISAAYTTSKLPGSRATSRKGMLKGVYEFMAAQ